MNQRGKADEHLKVDDLYDVSHWRALGEKTLKIEIATNSKGLFLAMKFLHYKFSVIGKFDPKILLKGKTLNFLGNSPRWGNS